MACYYPNGVIADGLQPCNTTAGAISSCCRIGDVCLTNGYCFSAGQNSVIRRGCTDQAFNSTECPQNCITGDVSSVDVVMTPCGDYTYFCCGQDDAARNCCTSGNGTVLVAAGTAILPTATITYNNTITSTTAPTSCPLINTTSSPSCEPTPNTIPIGAAAGLGAALVVAVLTAIAFAIMWRRNANQKEKTEQRVKEKDQLIKEKEQRIKEKEQRIKELEPMRR